MITSPSSLYYMHVLLPVLMESRRISSLVLTLILLSTQLFIGTTAEFRGISPLHLLPEGDVGPSQTYIVHVQPPETTTFSTPYEREGWYRSFLPPTALDDSGEPRLLYAYHVAISGFAARLTEDELVAMKEKSGFLLAYPDRVLHPQTTHSPAFLGLNRNASGLWQDSKFGKGVVIGVLDTGITAAHPSFNDVGMDPPPSTWQGMCQAPIKCNNKLIGAKSFAVGMHAMRGNNTAPSPVDADGHGTHTASTAAGRFVENAGVYGMATGTAAGMAPDAWLAIYRVCYPDMGCADSDILAGLDAAISDGVHIVSLSLGANESRLPNFYNDSLAIGAFGAIQHGVFVSAVAGNDGPGWRNVSNEAPWILTVGASTMNRSIKAKVTLGNGSQFDGQSLTQPTDFPSNAFPLIYPGADGSQSAYCSDLSGYDVKGKIVLCDRGSVNYTDKGQVRVKAVNYTDKGQAVLKAGGIAMIFVNYEEMGKSTSAYANVLPWSYVSFQDGQAIKDYLNDTENSTAAIQFLGTVIVSEPPSPMVASFSSRGPSQANSDILKPDILGPGVDVLAAWHTQVGPVKASSTFNIISGTSMATAHLSGIAALLKSMHPDWSPAAIKSAMMTTATTTNNVGQLIADESTGYNASFFSSGAGLVLPVQAANPGLVYNITPDDYIQYLCSIKYTDAQVTAIARRLVLCSCLDPILPMNLNYPSISLSLSLAGGDAQVVTRTVTNVGDSQSTYTCRIEAPPGVSMAVEPPTLYFAAKNEKQQFWVSFSVDGSVSDVSYRRGRLIWISATTNITVKSPIMVQLV